MSLALRSRSARAAASVSSRDAGVPLRAFVVAVDDDGVSPTGMRRLRGALPASVPRKSYIERRRMAGALLWRDVYCASVDAEKKRK